MIRFVHLLLALSLPFCIWGIFSYLVGPEHGFGPMVGRTEFIVPFFVVFYLVCNGIIALTAPMENDHTHFSNILFCTNFSLLMGRIFTGPALFPIALLPWCLVIGLFCAVALRLWRIRKIRN